jgi:hypothetical protein
MNNTVTLIPNNRHGQPERNVQIDAKQLCASIYELQKTEGYHRYESTFAHLRDGAFCWIVDQEARVIDPSICRENAIDQLAEYNAQVQADAYRAYILRSMDAYRKSEAKRKISSEEMGEMRSAFGKGVTVVNVLTGKRTKIR